MQFLPTTTSVGAGLAPERHSRSDSPLDWDWKLADMARGDAMTADAAVTAAVKAFPGWAATSTRERAGPFTPARRPHRRERPDAGSDRVRRHGNAPRDASGRAHPSWRRELPELRRPGRRPHAERQWSSKGTANTVQRMPAGPTVIITPWNAPWLLSTWKIAPALAAGNTVILKPAEWAPLSASLLADLADEAGMPAGVLNIVQGIGEEVGPALVDDPRVRRISFTGSPETARSIGAQRLPPTSSVHRGAGR